ncbi:alanine racemase [Clostridium oryzae]|uniref:Alanine racemase n=1 Tax=Clostridium oryzae TaxID=1450648 RepID=A0A1V4ITW0_9CLOT|nr:alanine racemase [Clostridium oryzae]OPJ62897.1 alanine racemase, biosynthetic [Clostridium oryzae]
MKTEEREFMKTSEGKSSRTVLEEINRANINLSQLRRNLEIIRSKLKPGVKFMGVVKGDAYGHGLVTIAEELQLCNCDAIGVVRLTEAVALREANIKIPIIILAPIMPSQVNCVVDQHITIMVDNEKTISSLDEYAAKQSKMAEVHVKVNTGLNRYGIEPKDVLGFITMIHNKYPRIKISGIYTHFKDPETNSQFTNEQIHKFNNVLNSLEREGLRPDIAHSAGSAGILMYPESHFDMVRCGLILYGLEHKEGDSSLPEGVKSIMSLESRILKIEKIKAGHSGGYGNSFVAKRDSYVAVVGMGYGDGISRGWKEVLIAERKVPVVNYFMDGILVDITDVVNITKEFDKVIIVGTQGNESISWVDACSSINTRMDEQLQRITERVPKHYFYN